MYHIEKREHKLKERFIRSSRRKGKYLCGLYFPRGLKRIIISDNRYRFRSLDEYLSILRTIEIGPYVDDFRDCDDFTLWLIANVKADPKRPYMWGSAIGECRGTYDGEGHEYHSLVVFWTAPNARHFYEPSTKNLVTFHPREIFI